jgi:hypothetical protein
LDQPLAKVRENFMLFVYELDAVNRSQVESGGTSDEVAEGKSSAEGVDDGDKSSGKSVDSSDGKEDETVVSSNSAEEKSQEPLKPYIPGGLSTLAAQAYACGFNKLDHGVMVLSLIHRAIDRFETYFVNPYRYRNLFLCLFVTCHVCFDIPISKFSFSFYQQGIIFLVCPYCFVFRNILLDVSFIEKLRRECQGLSKPILVRSSIMVLQWICCHLYRQWKIHVVEEKFPSMDKTRMQVLFQLTGSDYVRFLLMGWGTQRVIGYHAASGTLSCPMMNLRGWKMEVALPSIGTWQF